MSELFYLQEACNEGSNANAHIHKAPDPDLALEVVL